MADSSSASPQPAGTSPQRPSAVRFGVFEVDFEAAELRKRGLRVRLQEQPFRVLSLLLEQPGRVVNREELQSKLWPGDTFVDFDHGLNTAVNKIRQALGDSAANPRFVETMHRRGYRFIAPVERIGTAAAANATHPAVEPDQTEVPSEQPVAPLVEQAVRDPQIEDSQTSAAEAANAPSPSHPNAAQAGGVADPSPLRKWLHVGGIVVFSLTIAFGVMLVVTVFGFVRDRLARRDQPQRIAPAVVNRVRILAGQSNDYISGSEQLWSGDQFYVGGQASSRSGVAAGAEDPNLFLGERYGSFQYVIPAMPGKYRLKLHFAETWFGPGNQGGGGAGNRVFDVECNGAHLLRAFDIYREAGGANRALVRTFDGIEPDKQGRVVISFLPRANNGMVNALELIPME